MLIGMFHIRKDPNKVSRAYLYSAVAKLEGHDLFYFTARGVDFERKEIFGRHYEQGRWVPKRFPFPDVVINAANQGSDFQKQVENRLKRLIPFTSYPVGAKTVVYRKILKGEKYKEHVIPYKVLEASEEVFGFLDEHGKAVVKPVRGHHGEGVIAVERKGLQFFVHSGRRRLLFGKKEFQEYLDGLLEKRPMLAQKYIDCRLKTGEPFDFRIHLQKDRRGKWTITAIFPRIGSPERIITNLSRGSQMVELTSFLYREFREEGRALKKKLEEFGLGFVEHFETLYPHKFDELALDVGIDGMRKIWIYEVNWRPGHIFIEVQTAKNAIGYAIHLAETKEKYEKTET